MIKDYKDEQAGQKYKMQVWQYDSDSISDRQEYDPQDEYGEELEQKNRKPEKKVEFDPKLHRG
jgi:hypothetical protein